MNKKLVLFEKEVKLKKGGTMTISICRGTVKDFLIGFLVIIGIICLFKYLH